jgi:hypothetical protein
MINSQKSTTTTVKTKLKISKKHELCLKKNQFKEKKEEKKEKTQKHISKENKHEETNIYGLYNEFREGC